MKDFIRKALYVVGMILVSPLLIPFYLTTGKEVILTDVRRWIQIFSWTGKSDMGNLLSLLDRQKEFRNLYYHRLFKSVNSDSVISYQAYARGMRDPPPTPSTPMVGASYQTTG
jgi:hypothetical protein